MFRIGSDLRWVYDTDCKPSLLILSVKYREKYHVLLEGATRCGARRAREPRLPHFAWSSESDRARERERERETSLPRLGTALVHRTEYLLQECVWLHELGRIASLIAPIIANLVFGSITGEKLTASSFACESHTKTQLQVIFTFCNCKFACWDFFDLQMWMN